jgi:hypothetical protein
MFPLTPGCDGSLSFTSYTYGNVRVIYTDVITGLFGIQYNDIYTLQLLRDESFSSCYLCACKQNISPRDFQTDLKLHLLT